MNDSRCGESDHRNDCHLAAQEVSKIYQMGTNSVTALDNVSLEVREGEFVAIRGLPGRANRRY